LGLAGDGTVHIRGAVTDSVSARNGMAGFFAGSAFIGNGGFDRAHLSIIRSVAFGNGTFGAQADGNGGTVFLRENFVLYNGTVDYGFTNSGSLGSFGDNIVSFGSSNLSPTKR